MKLSSSLEVLRTISKGSTYSFIIILACFMWGCPADITALDAGMTEIDFMISVADQMVETDLSCYSDEECSQEVERISPEATPRGRPAAPSERSRGVSHHSTVKSFLDSIIKHDDIPNV